MSLTLEQAKTALRSILSELAKPNIADAILDARLDAKSDINRIMELVVPIFFEVQGHIMEPLGFEPTDDGFGDFADALKSHECDADFALLSAELKALMKASTTPPTAAAIAAREAQDAAADAEEAKEEEKDAAAQ